MIWLLLGEYAEGKNLTVFMLRRKIMDLTDYDTLQVTSALRYSDRQVPWTVLSWGRLLRIHLPEIPGTAMVSPLILAIQARYQEDPDQDSELPNNPGSPLVLLTT